MKSQIAFVRIISLSEAKEIAVMGGVNVPGIHVATQLITELSQSTVDGHEIGV